MLLLKSLNYKSTILTRKEYKTTPVNRQMHGSSDTINPFVEFKRDASLENQESMDQFYIHLKNELSQGTPLREILETYNSNYEMNVNPGALIDGILYLAAERQTTLLTKINDNMSLIIFKDNLMYINESNYGNIALTKHPIIGGYFKKVSENSPEAELFTAPGVSKGTIIVHGWEQKDMPALSGEGSGEDSAALSGSGDGYNWKLIFVLTVASLWALVHIITYINDKFTEWENQKKLAEKPVEVTPQTEKDPENHRELSSVLEDFDNTVIMIISFLLVSCNLLSVIYLYRYYFISKLKNTKHDKHISN